MVILKQFSPIALICVESNCPCIGFAMALLGYRVTCASNSNNNNKTEKCAYFTIHEKS